MKKFFAAPLGGEKHSVRRPYRAALSASRSARLTLLR